MKRSPSYLNFVIPDLIRDDHHWKRARFGL